MCVIQAELVEMQQAEHPLKEFSLCTMEFWASLARVLFQARTKPNIKTLQSWIVPVPQMDLGSRLKRLRISFLSAGV